MSCGSHTLVDVERSSNGNSKDNLIDSSDCGIPSAFSMPDGMSQSGRVLTYFDRIGTVGMERDYSWSSVPFQAFDVHFEFPGNRATEQPTRTENNPTDFCGGTAQLDPKTGVPSCGERVLLTQRTTLHAKIPQGKPQSSGASRPSRTFGESLEVMISPSRLRRLLTFL